MLDWIVFIEPELEGEPEYLYGQADFHHNKIDFAMEYWRSAEHIPFENTFRLSKDIDLRFK